MDSKKLRGIIAVVVAVIMAGLASAVQAELISLSPSTLGTIETILGFVGGFVLKSPLSSGDNGAPKA